MPEPLTVLKALGTAASVIAGLKKLFDDDGSLDDKLDDVLKKLQGLRSTLVTGIRDILEAIDGIRRQIDEDVALDNIVLADRALFSDLAVFGDKQAAMGNSFQAADRLFREDDVVFAGPFIYVVNFRLAILKDFDENYFCNQQFQQEFAGYISHLNVWISQLNNAIRNSHTVEVTLFKEFDKEFKPPLILSNWEARHFRKGAVVETFVGPINNTGQAARQTVEQQANASRKAGIEKDRQDFGVIHMEETVATWQQAFQLNLRLALVSQLLNRSSMAIDFNPDGLMVDGRMVPASLSLKSTLTEVLLSREFLRRIQKSVDAFTERRDDRLVRLAYERLFQRDPNDDEVSLLQGIAKQYGYSAFISVMLNSKEYNEKHGNGIPSGGKIIASDPNHE